MGRRYIHAGIQRRDLLKPTFIIPDLLKRRRTEWYAISGFREFQYGEDSQQARRTESRSGDACEANRISSCESR